MQDNHIDIDFVVCSLRYVAQTLEQARAEGRPFDGMITVHSTRPQDQVCMPYDSLRLPDWFDAVNCRMFIDCPENGELTAAERKTFTSGIVAAAHVIERLAKSTPGGKPRILVHCFSGNTRSVSVVAALLEHLDPIGMANKISKLLDSRPNAQPRDDLVGMAARALHRARRMFVPTPDRSTRIEDAAASGLLYRAEIA